MKDWPQTDANITVVSKRMKISNYCHKDLELHEVNQPDRQLQHQHDDDDDDY